MFSDNVNDIANRHIWNILQVSDTFSPIIWCTSAQVTNMPTSEAITAEIYE